MTDWKRCKPGAPAALASFGFALLAAAPAAAYVGPGAGLSAIGTLLALVAALCLAVVGFVWYPLKRVLKRGAPAKATTPARKAAEREER